MLTLLSVARTVVFAVFVVAAFAAVASWLVRTRRVSPFSGLGGFLRRASDPIIRPIETRVVRMGGQPAQASFWLVIGTAIGGILLLTVLQFGASIIVASRAAAAGGVLGIVAFLVDVAFKIVLAALIIRVIASWFGMGRYNRWIRPTYTLTDWIVEPLRRVVPPIGAFDFTPIVAGFVVLLLRAFVFGVLL
jgi:YggT family protein